MVFDRDLLKELRQEAVEERQRLLEAVQRAVGAIAMIDHMLSLLDKDEDTGGHDGR